MSGLRKALANRGNSPAEIEDIIKGMVEEVDNGEDPEEVLFDEGLEPDYVMDLLDECLPEVMGAPADSGTASQDEEIEGLDEGEDDGQADDDIDAD
jgi:hypothetical protein